MQNLLSRLRPTHHAAFVNRTAASIRCLSSRPSAEHARASLHATQAQGVPVTALNQLLRSLKHSLEREQYSVASSNFHKSLSAATFKNASRFHAYEGAVTLFIVHGRFQDAREAFNRLKSEGFIPSVSLRSRVFVLNAILNDPEQEILFKAAGQVFAQKDFDERCLRHLLQMIFRSVRCAPSTIQGLVDLFCQSRESDFVLSEGTQKTVAYLHNQVAPVKDLDTRVERIKDPETRAYAASLRQRAQSDPENATIYNSAVRRVLRDGPPSDFSMYNILIGKAIHERKYRRGFSIYRMLMDNCSTKMTPDAYTFGSLFAGCVRLSQDRTLRSGRHRPPNPSRKLYADMMQCHLIRTKGRPSEHSTVITSSLLNNALRAFTSVFDYAAAYVAVRTFRICKLSPTLSTYRAVISSLMSRIHRELPRISASRKPHAFWSYRFLGHPPSPKIEMNIHLLETVLRLGEVSRLGLDHRPRFAYIEHAPADESAPPPEPPSDATGASPPAPVPSASTPTPAHTGPFVPTPRIPSAQAVAGLEKPKHGQNWDLLPLERILKRAILANYQENYMPPAKLVSLDIADAKATMIPRMSKAAMKPRKSKAVAPRQSKTTVVPRALVSSEGTAADPPVQRI